MKCSIIFSFLAFLLAAYSDAQPLRTKPPVVVASGTKIKSAPGVLVTFITDDTCYMSIDDKSYKEFPKTKVVELAVGRHRLFFESLETGRTVRDRAFFITREMLASGKYDYVIKLKP